MQQICTSGSMSGERKRSHGQDCDTGSGESRRPHHSPRPTATAPPLDSTPPDKGIRANVQKEGSKMVSQSRRYLSV